MRVGTCTLAVLAALSLFGAPVAHADPGDLDRSFANLGKLTIDFGGDEGALGLLAAPQGQLLLPGYVGADSAAWRLNRDGSRDQNFSLDGAAVVPYGVPSRARAIALQNNGKVVLAGQTLPAGGGDDIAVAELNGDGSPYAGFFDATGKRTLNLFGADGAAAVMVQPNGRIVVAGHGGANTNMIQARFTADGGIDSSFGGGFGYTGQDLGGSEIGLAAALQPDGKIVTVGSSSRAPEWTFSRVNADGSPDTTLETDGNISFGGAVAAYAVTILSDGKFLIAGTTAAPASDMYVTKMNPDATTDRSFGNNGRVTVDLGGADVGRAIAVQANGKIVVAGSTTNGNDMVAVRLQPGGALDTTFANGGKRTIDFGRIDTAYGVGLTDDGKIVLGGTTGGAPGNENVVVARLDGGEAATGGGPAGGGGGTGGGGGKAKVFRCAGKPATIIGTNRSERLRGTKRADVIVALGGNDKVDGRGGNDVICAGNGNDNVKGGDGNDEVLGGSGNDVVSGGNGKDRISGERGKDKLAGGVGNDSLDGGPGNDKLSGQGGNDSLRGRAGRDALSGGAGKDKQKQ